MNSHQIQRPPTSALSLPLGPTSTSLAPLHRPRPSSLKTSSKPSLPMQTTIFNVMNGPNLGAHTSQPPHHRLSSMVTASLVKSTTRTWSSSHSPWTHMDASVQCYKPSSPRPTTHPTSLGARPLTTANATALTPT